MAHSNTILHQLLCLLPRHQFDEFVSGLDGDRYVKTFSTWNQLFVLLYAQASGKQSLLFYRVPLLDPDRCFNWLEPKLRWVWTTGFLLASSAAMLFALLILWANRADAVA